MSDLIADASNNQHSNNRNNDRRGSSRGYNFFCLFKLFFKK